MDVAKEQIGGSNAQDAIRCLAASVAHDFNNILAVILGHADLLVEEAPNETNKESLSAIRSAALRGRHLTGQLLAFGRTQILRARFHDLNDVVTDMTSAAEQLLGEDIALIVSTASVPVPVLVDRAQLEQAVYDLFLSCKSAMSGSGTLTIETNDLEDGPFAMLTLRHDGAGMNRDDAERVFDPPFLSKDRGRGTGLGLAPVLGMIEQSGGTIRAKGHQGPGIVFEICLPRAQPERDSSDPHRAQASVETRAAEAATVLLVEDDDAVRRVVAETLRRQGYSVVDFPRGADAVSFCEYYAGPIDLLLTDVVMPEMSGPELGKRALELRPTLRVLYMSGYTDVGIVRDGVLDEGVSFLQKPVTREALLQAVQATLATLAPGRTSA